MSKRPSNLNLSDEELSLELSQALGKVVRDLLKTKGMTQADLARELGYTRVSVCQMLSPTESLRAWRLVALCGVSRIFGVQISTLIAAAEAAMDNNPVSLTLASLSLSIIGTEPRTRERLQEIIREATGTHDCEDVELFEIGCAHFTDDYLEGKLSDMGAFDLLRNAAGNRKTPSGKVLPLWATVAMLYK
jgi:transcriptional regulator with XRE-family HTH domain